MRDEKEERKKQARSNKQHMYFSCAGSMSLNTCTVSVLLEVARYRSSVLNDRQLM